MDTTMARTLTRYNPWANDVIFGAVAKLRRRGDARPQFDKT